MNVYDFDKTTYCYDSSIRFFLFCYKKYPKLWLTLPKQGVALLRYKVKLDNAHIYKQKFFSFLKHIDNIDTLVEAFWQGEFSNMATWYLQQKKPDDVIISASPAFLLTPVSSRLGVTSVIATLMEQHSGQIIGKNCKGREKVKRFLAAYPDAQIDEFYSDSYTDLPLAKLAKTAYLVKGNVLKKWL